MTAVLAPADHRDDWPCDRPCPACNGTDEKRDEVEIRLTQGLFAVVDARDVQMLIRFKWSAHRTSRCGLVIWYARAHIGLGRRKLMHNLLVGQTGIDHINGDGLDNRRSNLRYATHHQNGGNRRKVAVASSQFKGVSWQRGVGRWKAQVRTRGYTQYLGLFDDEEAAARAYDVAARGFFGEFAALNFPAVGERSAFRRGVA